MKLRFRRRAAALVVALLTLMVVMLVTGAVLQALLSYRRQALLMENELQAEWLAEAAVDGALAKRARDVDFHGDERQIMLDDSDLQKSRADVKTEIRPAGGGQNVQVTARAVYPARSLRQVTVERNYTLPNTSAARANRR